MKRTERVKAFDENNKVRVPDESSKKFLGRTRERGKEKETEARRMFVCIQADCLLYPNAGLLYSKITLPESFQRSDKAEIITAIDLLDSTFAI